MTNRIDFKTFFEENIFYRTPEGKIARFIRKDKFYVDLELADREEVSYQLAQVSLVDKLTEKERDEFVLDYLISYL
jgi:hypothetical protein